MGYVSVGSEKWFRLRKARGLVGRQKQRRPGEPTVIGVSGPAAFGHENHFSKFDWDAYYGEGFDVYHLTDTDVV